MARGGKIGYKRRTRNNVLLGKKGSDESDEDYMVGEDEFNESEDEYCSLAEDESDDNLEEFMTEEEEEQEEEEDSVKKKVQRPRGRKGFQWRNNNGVLKPRKKKLACSERGNYDCDDFSGSKTKRKNMLSHREEEDDAIEFLYSQDKNDFVGEKSRKKNQISCTERYDDCYDEKPRKKPKVSYQEEEEDGDFDDSDEDDDEEFTPDEVDGVDEEELPGTKKNKVGKLRMKETQITKGQKRKGNNKALRRTKRKKPMKEKVFRRKSTSDHGRELKGENPVLPKRKKIIEPVWGNRGRRSLDSDSDFVNSGSSDYEYTVSEEEREQVREAREFCGRLTVSLRSSSSLKTVVEEEVLPIQRKCPGRKGKEKVVDVKIAAGRQVCGICLSEEGKRTVRGILNCCSHYFCFACIMEWSKVESRCPLCKQRFTTIRRTAREDGGHDLRDLVIQVPERDQVYQPSEEELRGYLDPYENVLCTECLQGGDDALMLLCDICDSPAHSYCVGLGHEVPEGNWYCNGCRPTALASSNVQPFNPSPDQGLANNFSVGASPVASVRETFDLNELYVPETPLTQLTGHSQSPRHSVGDFQAASPVSGSGALTLYDRRRIQRQIHQLLNNRNRHLDGNDDVTPVSAISLFGSQISRDEITAHQHTVIPSRMAPQNICHQGRLLDHAMPSLFRREVVSPRFSNLRGQVLHNQASTSTDHSFDGPSHRDFFGFNGRIDQDVGHQQLHPCSTRSNTGADASISQFQFREATVPSTKLQGSLHTPF